MASALLDFDQQKVFTKSIEIEDIGNVALRCTNNEFEEYYLVNQTNMGKTSILKFGPVMEDLEVIESTFDLNYKQIDYKETKILKEINLLINDVRKQINQVEIIKIEDALNMIPTADKFIPV